MIIINHLPRFVEALEHDSHHAFQIAVQGDQLEIHIFDSIPKDLHARILALVDDYDEYRAMYSIKLLRSTEMHLACKHMGGRWFIKGVPISSSVRDEMKGVLIADPRLMDLIAEAGGDIPFYSFKYVHTPTLIRRVA